MRYFSRAFGITAEGIVHSEDDFGGRSFQVAAPERAACHPVIRCSRGEIGVPAKLSWFHVASWLKRFSRANDESLDNTRSATAIYNKLCNT